MAFNKHDISDITQFVKVMRQAFRSERTRPEIVLVDRVLDFKRWFRYSYTPSLVGIRAPYGFQFMRDSDTGRAGFRYKQYPASDAHWLGQDGKENGPLFHMLRQFPQGRPEYERAEWRDSLGDPIAELAETAEKFLSRDQIDWLRSVAYTGSLGANIVESKSDTGYGQPGVCTVGSNSEQVRVLRDFASDAEFWRVPQQQASAHGHVSMPLSSELKEPIVRMRSSRSTGRARRSRPPASQSSPAGVDMPDARPSEPSRQSTSSSDALGSPASSGSSDQSGQGSVAVVDALGHPGSDQIGEGSVPVVIPATHGRQTRSGTRAQGLQMQWNREYGNMQSSMAPARNQPESKCAFRPLTIGSSILKRLR